MKVYRPMKVIMGCKTREQLIVAVEYAKTYGYKIVGVKPNPIFPKSIATHNKYWSRLNPFIRMQAYKYGYVDDGLLGRIINIRYG